MTARCHVADDPKLVAEHADWLQRDRDGQPRPALCLNGPYVAKFIWPWMTHELADPACEGLEFKLSEAASAPCWCEACTQHLTEARLNSEDAAVRANFAECSLQRFKDETRTYAEAVRPGTRVSFT